MTFLCRVTAAPECILNARDLRKQVARGTEDGGETREEAKRSCKHSRAEHVPTRSSSPLTVIVITDVEVYRRGDNNSANESAL